MLTPKIAYSWNLQSFSKSQGIVDATFIQKSKTIRYVKSGLGLSYWLTTLDKGFFLEGELQGLINFSANSNETTIQNGNLMKNNVDFKEEVKTFVPSLRLGFGHKFAFSNKISMYLQIGLEIKVNSNYTNQENFRIFNSMMDLGFNYKIKSDSN